MNIILPEVKIEVPEEHILLFPATTRNDSDVACG